MGSQFWWIFDALVILVAGYVLYTNIKRGMTKVMVLSIGYIIATFLASVIAAFGAQPVYESVAQNSNVSAVEAVNEHVNLSDAFAEMINSQDYGFHCTGKDISSLLEKKDYAQFDHALYEFADRKSNGTVGDEGDFRVLVKKTFIQAYGEAMGDKLPRYAQTSFETQVNTNSEVMRGIVSALYDRSRTTRETAEEIETLFAEEATVEVLRIFIYLIILSVLMVIAAVINSVLQNRMFFNLTAAKERFYGGLFGLLEVGVMLILLTLLVRLLVLLGGGKMFCFSDEAINKTFLFKFLYGHLSALL